MICIFHYFLPIYKPNNESNNQDNNQISCLLIKWGWKEVLQRSLCVPVNQEEINEVCCSRKGGGFKRIHGGGEIISMGLLGLDRSQLNVKGGHPPHFYLLMSEMLLLRNLLACPRNTPKDKTERLWSEELQSAQHNVEKCAEDVRSIKHLSGEISALILSEGSFCCLSRQDGHQRWTRGDAAQSSISGFHVKRQFHASRSPFCWFLITWNHSHFSSKHHQLKPRSVTSSLRRPEQRHSFQSPLLLHIREIMCSQLWCEAAYKSWNRSQKAFNVLQ